MKMHPRPMKRHTNHVAPCSVLVVSGSRSDEPVHMLFGIDGKSQRVIMTPEEARGLARALQGAADDFEK